MEVGVKTQAPDQPQKDRGFLPCLRAVGLQKQAQGPKGQALRGKDQNRHQGKAPDKNRPKRSGSHTGAQKRKGFGKKRTGREVSEGRRRQGNQRREKPKGSQGRPKSLEKSPQSPNKKWRGLAYAVKQAGRNTRRQLKGVESIGRFVAVRPYKKGGPLG